MKREFWLERWRQGRISFHRSEHNPYLVRHLPALGLGPGSAVLVPLCGKSLDLHLLRRAGYRVVGVEVAPLAVEAFFADAGLQPERSRQGPFERYSTDGIDILCGDFFALRPSSAPRFAAVYDRAALIALPAPMRERYAVLVAELLHPGATGLLIALEFTKGHWPGPPHEVSEAEVRSLYEPAFDVTVLERTAPSPASPCFQEGGLLEVRDVVYLLVRR